MPCLTIISTFCKCVFDREKLITVCTFWRIRVFNKIRMLNDYVGDWNRGGDSMAYYKIIQYLY